MNYDIQDNRRRISYKELRIKVLQVIQTYLLKYKATEDKFYYDIAMELSKLSKEWKEEIDKLK